MKKKGQNSPQPEPRVSYSLPEAWDSPELWQKAHESALPYALKAMSLLDSAPDPGLPLDETGVAFRTDIQLTLYHLGDGEWLKACKLQINAAIERGDESFFVRLGKLIDQRRKFQLKNAPFWWTASEHENTVPEKRNLVPEFVGGVWVEWPLWLMPDPVAHAFLTRFTPFKITVAAYTKMRQRMKLFQHPKLPVTSFTVDGVPLFRKGRTKTKRTVSS